MLLDLRFNVCRAVPCDRQESDGTVSSQVNLSSGVRDPFDQEVYHADGEWGHQFGRKLQQLQRFDHNAGKPTPAVFVSNANLEMRAKSWQISVGTNMF